MLWLPQGRAVPPLSSEAPISTHLAGSPCPAVPSHPAQSADTPKASTALVQNLGAPVPPSAGSPLPRFRVSPPVPRPARWLCGAPEPAPFLSTCRCLGAVLSAHTRARAAAVFTKPPSKLLSKPPWFAVCAPWAAGVTCLHLAFFSPVRCERSQGTPRPAED